MSKAEARRATNKLSEQGLSWPDRLKLIFSACSWMAEPGDVPVEEYTAEGYDNDAEYDIDSIVAEKKRGKATLYLVKWKV